MASKQRSWPRGGGGSGKSSLRQRERIYANIKCLRPRANFLGEQHEFMRTRAGHGLRQTKTPPRQTPKMGLAATRKTRRQKRGLRPLREGGRSVLCLAMRMPKVIWHHIYIYIYTNVSFLYNRHDANTPAAAQYDKIPFFFVRRIRFLFFDGSIGPFYQPSGPYGYNP